MFITLKDDENSTLDTSYQRQMVRAIIAAFRTRNALAEMMLNEFFEAFKNDEEEMVIANFFFQCVGKFSLSNLLGFAKLSWRYEIDRNIE